MVYNKTSCRVIYGDTDKMGYAYHAHYFRWFEIGRTELLRSLGLSYKTIEEKGIFLPVAEAHCNYVTPIMYDDTLIVETGLDDGVKGSFKFDYRLYRESDTLLIAEGYTRHPCINDNGKVVRPPQFLLDLIAKIKDLG